MDPYRAQWQYGYTADPNQAYASYYQQLYTGTPAPVPAPPNSVTAPAYTSDFSSGTSHFQTPPQANSNIYPRRPKMGNHNLQSISVNSQPPPPPPAPNAGYGAKPAVQNWQQLKQTQNEPLRPPAPAAQRFFPMKKFVKPREAMTQEELEQGPNCEKVCDLAKYNRISMSFEKIESEVSPGVFAVRLSLGSEIYPGTGNSYKQAKEAAAVKALEETTYTKPVFKQTMKGRPQGATATQELFVVAQKKGVAPKFTFLEPANFEYKQAMRNWTKSEMKAYYKVQLTVGEHRFIGEADLPQHAKHDASSKALPVLHSLPDIAPAPKLKSESNADTPDATSIGTLPNGKNVIMALNEIAMQQLICIEWTMVSENGPPHLKTYTWQMKMGDYAAKGTGISKKLARTYAALNIYETIPEEWKVVEMKKSKKKRKSNNSKAAQTPAKQPKLEEVAPAPPSQSLPVVEPQSTKPKAAGKGQVPVHEAVLATNPISAIYEYCKKAKLADPEFEIASENVIQSWSHENRNYKKTEYTMKLEVNNQTFFSTGFTKKAAKQAVATEAWNILRTGMM